MIETLLSSKSIFDLESCYMQYLCPCSERLHQAKNNQVSWLHRIVSEGYFPFTSLSIVKHLTGSLFAIRGVDYARSFSHPAIHVCKLCFFRIAKSLAAHECCRVAKL